MSCFYFCFFLLIFVFKVLGSPSLCLVADGQARMPVINGRTATPAEGRIIVVIQWGSTVRTCGFLQGFRRSRQERVVKVVKEQLTVVVVGRCPFLSLSSEFALQGSLTGQ